MSKNTKENINKGIYEVVDAAFSAEINNYIEGQTTSDDFSQNVRQYINEHLPIESEHALYVKTIIGDVSYMDISSILDDLINKSAEEKCCKYDADKKIFLITLIITNGK
jgi:hypothetical protein